MHKDYKIVYSHRSDKDLDDIIEYILIEKSSPIAAIATVERIRKAISKLKAYPRRNSTVKLRRGIFYRLIMGNYLVFYKIKDNEIIIAYIIYGKRNYIGLL